MLKKSKEVKTSKNNKIRNIILIVLGLLLLVVSLFLLWFFNRKFEVIFDYNNGTKNETILVKYNKYIDNKNVKTKEDLGEQFIDWYLILDNKDGEDVLSDKPFDFKIKIDKDTKLKAVYKGVVETITISFDSKGGTKVNDIVINKVAELTLPKNPTYKGYTFKEWVDKKNRPINNKTVFNKDTTLYAKWEKVVEKTTEIKKEEKKETTKVVTTKKEKTTTEKVKEQVKEEKISLSLSNYYISINGTRTSNATASVENASGAVTYSISSVGCATIDSNTGVITAVSVTSRDLRSICYGSGETIKVTATLPSGKSASKTLTFEKNLLLTVGDYDYISTSSNKYFPHNRDNTFTITANQEVSWSATEIEDGTESKTSTTYSGKASTAGNGYAYITARTKSGQKVEIYTVATVN